MDEQPDPNCVTTPPQPPVPSEARELIRDWEFLFWAFLLFGLGRLASPADSCSAAPLVF